MGNSEQDICGRGLKLPFFPMLATSGSVVVTTHQQDRVLEFLSLCMRSAFGATAHRRVIE
jgi:hypothetical protein